MVRSSSAGIHYWMPDSATTRFFQAERDNAIVAQLPDPSLGFHAAGLLYAIAHCHLGKGDAQPDDVVVGKALPWRFPIAFSDDEFHGLEALLPRWIVAIAPTDETVTVLGEELLRALLARLEMQPHPRGGRLGGALVHSGRGSTVAFRPRGVQER